MAVDGTRAAVRALALGCILGSALQSVWVLGLVLDWGWVWD